MLYLAGARWVLLLLAVVTALLCIQLPRDSIDGAAAAAGPAVTTTLPVQQPASVAAAALPREAPAEGEGLRGLGASSSSSVLVVAVMPAYAWSKKAGDDDDGECAICLGDVRRGQVVKQLPACTHLFHTGCIDEWLTSSQGTCPVCRTPVDSAAAGLQVVRVADQPP
uniref:RING-type E3 ubiquitin transferase n=1 Tax=Oryza punctata TaxID=4537 RepID=A0A0E0LCA9_ORYPU